MPGDVKMRGRLGRESVGRLSNGNLVSVPQSLQSEASQTALSQLNLLTNYCWQSSEHGFRIDFVMNATLPDNPITRFSQSALLAC